MRVRPVVGAAAALWAFAVLGMTVAPQPTGRPGLAGLPSNSVALIKAHQIRMRLAAAGFTDIVNLDEDERGGWSCRALRSGTAVRVAIDRRGAISIM